MKKHKILILGAISLISALVVVLVKHSSTDVIYSSTESQSSQVAFKSIPNAQANISLDDAKPTSLEEEISFEDDKPAAIVEQPKTDNQPTKKPAPTVAGVESASEKPNLAVYATPYSTPYSTPYTTPYGTPYATPYPTPASTTACTSGTFTQQFLCYLNEHRKEQGKSAVKSDSALQAVAQKHSVWMQTNATMSHTGENGSNFSDRCEAAGITCNAENVARGAKSAEQLFNLWKNSPGHNKNMLGPYSVIGLGIAGEYYTLIFR